MNNIIPIVAFAAVLTAMPVLAGQDELQAPVAHETQIMKPKADEPQILTLDVDEPRSAKPDMAKTESADAKAAEAMPVKTAKVDGKADDTISATKPAGSPAPVNGRIIHQSDSGKMCIGGVLCPKFCEADTQDCKPTKSLTIKLDKPAQINTIQLSAHDNIGQTRRSRLVVKLNGKEIADTLVYKLGSTLSIDVGQAGELITIESAHQYNGFLLGGEEAVIWDVYVFGEDQS
jgi:hypothetical protein